MDENDIKLKSHRSQFQRIYLEHYEIRWHTLTNQLVWYPHGKKERLIKLHNRMRSKKDVAIEREVNKRSLLKERLTQCYIRKRG